MSEINLKTACQLFETQVTLQYQNRLKLQDTIEERHGLRGTHLNIPVSNSVEMNISSFETLTSSSGGILSTAPAAFTASTIDNEATLTKPDYINDFYERKQIKEQDWWFINYAGNQSSLFIVKNTAKKEFLSIQLIKIIDLKPVPPSEEE